MDVVIRQAVEQDMDSIASIYSQAVSERIFTFDAFPVTDSKFQAFFRYDKRRCIVVAAVDERVIGWTSVAPISDRWAYRYTCLGSFYVHKDFRGQHIGRRLKEAQIDYARRLGYHSMVVEVLSTNTTSIAMNLAQGFAIIGEEVEAGFRDGRWIGLIRMQKILQEDPVVERRVCFSIITENLDDSIALYKDALGLDMRPFSNGILMFPLGDCEFQVCYKDAVKDLLEFEFAPDQINSARGLLITLRYDSEQQMTEAGQAALDAGASLIGQSRSRSWSIEDFNGVNWLLTSFEHLVVR